MSKYGYFNEDNDVPNGWIVDRKSRRLGPKDRPYSWAPICERCTEDNAKLIAKLLNEDAAKTSEATP